MTDPTEMTKERRGVMAYHVSDPNVPFVRADILWAAAAQERVILFVEKVPVPGLPANVTVVVDVVDWRHVRPIATLMRHLPSVLGIYLVECLRTRRYLPFAAAMRRLAANLVSASAVMRKLRDLDALHAWHYSFWSYDCVPMAWLKMRGHTSLAVARAHGGDLYEERGSLRGVLFRHFTFRHLDAVHSVSHAGADYLRRRYPRYAHKMHVSYLGSAVPKAIPPMPGPSPLVLVSCARVRNVKRIHLIAEALCHVDIPVRWVHFGDEGEHSSNPSVVLYRQAMQRLATKSLVEVVRPGAIDNEALMAWYAAHPVHLFISLSENEGIPVSIMEAISHGIPVLATDVGGCREIVTERTGMLVPVDVPVEEVARTIGTFAASPMNTPAFRQGVRSFWEEHFNSETNYERFFAELPVH